MAGPFILCSNTAKYPIKTATGWSLFPNLTEPRILTMGQTFLIPTGLKLNPSQSQKDVVYFMKNTSHHFMRDITVDGVFGSTFDGEICIMARAHYPFSISGDKPLAELIPVKIWTDPEVNDTWWCDCQRWQSVGTQTNHGPSLPRGEGASTTV